jgi:hypothetical protein
LHASEVLIVSMRILFLKILAPIDFLDFSRILILGMQHPLYVAESSCSDISEGKGDATEEGDR